MFLAGYSVECLLKTKLMRRYDCRHLRELRDELRNRGILATEASIFTHELYRLLKLADGIHRLRQDQRLWRSFNLVNRWVPAWRYSADSPNPEHARDFLDAVESISRWIEHNI